MYCPACRAGECGKCPDKVFLIMGRPLICSCTRPQHEDLIYGEPRAQQVEDPFTGDIHAPGLVVSAEDGQVKYTGGEQ